MNKKILLLFAVPIIVVFLASLGFTGLTGSLVSYWTLNESSGNMIDVVASNDGTVTSATRGQQGILNSSVLFDGTDDYIDFGRDGSLDVGSNDFTFSIWVNATALQSGGDKIFMKGLEGGAPDKRIVLEMANTTSVRADVDDAVAAKQVTGDIGITDSLWHHLVLVRDGNNLRIYEDGTEASASPTDITGLGSLDSTGEDLVLGVTSDGEAGAWWAGKMDEFGFWTRALTAAEVASLYNSGLAAPYPFTPIVTTTLDSPADGLTFYQTTQEFNVTNVPTLGNLTNVTYTIWYTNGTVFNESIRSVNGTASNTTALTLTGLILENYKWNALGCAYNFTGANTV